MKVRALKPKKCRWCNQQFTPKVSLQVVCSASCAVQLTRKKEVDKKVKGFKENLKTLGQYETEARSEFQKWIRKVRDKDQPCISCGAKQAKQFDAGHFFSANQFSALIFCEENVHKQCSVCNDYLSGNLLLYREGIIQRYGLPYLIELESKKDISRNYKYTKQELIEIKEKYKQLNKG